MDEAADDIAGPGRANPLDWVRVKIAGAVRSLVNGGSEHSALDVASFKGPPGDPGLFGPESVAWRVGSDAAMLIGGVRALLLQTAHPLAMAGVAEHSNYRSDPWGRLQRTATYVSTTTFGSTAAAHSMIERVTAVHKSVNGTAADGRRYSALDPELLCWVHVTEIDSFATAVQHYGDIDLSDDDVDQYFREMANLGRLMGATGVPESRSQTSAYYADISSQLGTSKQAREAVRFLLWPPVSAKIRPAYIAVVASAIAILPADIKSLLWLPDVPTLEKYIVQPTGRRLSDLLGWALGDSPILDLARQRTGTVRSRAS